MFYSSAFCMQLRVRSSPESPGTGLLGVKLLRHLGGELRSRSPEKGSCLQVQSWYEIIVCTLFPDSFCIVRWEADNKGLRKYCQGKKSRQIGGPQACCCHGSE